MSSRAEQDFFNLINSVDELIAIHGQLQAGRGRRHRQEALHRAGVVLIVAAWQSYIEKVCNEALNLIENSLFEDQKPKVPAWVKSSFNFRKPSVRKSIGDLNTPNSQNVQRLFEWSFGYNPRKNWTWYSGRRQWPASTFCEKTDSWLRIRHTIAHGNELPKNLPWIKNSSGTPRLNLALLKECKRHFEKLVLATDKGFSRYLKRQYSVRTGWY